MNISIAHDSALQEVANIFTDPEVYFTHKDLEDLIKENAALSFYVTLDYYLAIMQGTKEEIKIANPNKKALIDAVYDYECNKYIRSIAKLIAVYIQENFNMHKDNLNKLPSLQISLEESSEKFLALLRCYFNELTQNLVTQKLEELNETTNPIKIESVSKAVPKLMADWKDFLTRYSPLVERESNREQYNIILAKCDKTYSKKGLKVNLKPVKPARTVSFCLDEPTNQANEAQLAQNFNLGLKRQNSAPAP